MGISKLPRIYFNGMFHWNPSTFNNNDYINTYNPFHVELNRAWLEDQGVHSKEDFRKWAIQSQPVGNGLVSPPSEWNFHGGMQASFLSESSPKIENSDFSRPEGGTFTSGYTGQGGKYVDSKDAWLNQQVQFNAQNVPGKLVDVDPTCFWSSQFYSDTFQLGSEKSGAGFRAPVTLPSHSRWINLSRNYNTNGEIIIAGGISCVWQTCFHKEDLEFFAKKPAPGSFQQQLEAALKAADAKGIMLRWVTYDTLYFQGSAFDGIPAANVNLRMDRVARIFQQYADEMEAFRSGKTNKKPETPINRAYSKAVGWLGLWNEGELMTVPSGRQLYAGNTVVQAAGLPASYYQQDSSGSSSGQVALAPAEVEVAYDGDSVSRITLDLGSTMPEVQIDGEKANFGEVQLVLLAPGSGDLGIPIAHLPNSKESYLRTSGMVDIPATKFLTQISKDEIIQTKLALTVENFQPDDSGETDKKGKVKGSTTRKVGLTEVEYTANTDSRAVYANEPEPDWDRDAADSTFTVQVRYFGGLPPEGTRIAFGQYAPDPLMVSSGNWSITKRDSKTQQSPFAHLYQPLEGERDVVIGQSTLVDVPATGEVTVAARALRPGFANIAFYPVGPGDDFKGPAPFVPAPSISQAYYCVVRSLPFDNLAAVDFENWLKSKPDQVHLPDVSLVNQRVFDEVFGVFYRLYPVMDFLANPTKFQEWRGRILAVTDPAIFDSATYMPVTRNLSAGNRRILELWDEYLSGHTLGSRQDKALGKRKPQIR